MSDTLAPLIPLLLILVVFWLLVLRPARRQREQASKLQASLEVGREVMTTSGIFGVVVALDESDVHLRIADGVVIRMHRQAIGQVVDPDADAERDTDTGRETDGDAGR